LVYEDVCAGNNTPLFGYCTPVAAKPDLQRADRAPLNAGHIGGKLLLKFAELSA
jgi:hypothetical protein